MTDARPKLEVVPGGGGSAEPAPEPAAPRGGRRLVWLLGILLVLAVIGLGIESRRAAELSGRVERLSAELESHRDGRERRLPHQAALLVHQAFAVRPTDTDTTLAHGREYGVAVRFPEPPAHAGVTFLELRLGCRDVRLGLCPGRHAHQGEADHDH